MNKFCYNIFISFILDGSFDNGDPNTTNLYLGNLNPKVIFSLIYYKLSII